VSDTPCELALLSDEDLVKQIVQRAQPDDSAFELLVHRYSRRLFRIALSVVRNEAEAEDVVQESFLSAYQHLAQFAGRSRFSTWLARIALYRALAHNSHISRHVSLDDSDREDQPVRVVADTSPTPEQQTYLGEMTALMSAAIAALPESYRSVLVLREFEELDTDQTARALHISRANVKVRLHRARAMIRTHYDGAQVPGLARAEPSSADTLASA